MRTEFTLSILFMVIDISEKHFVLTYLYIYSIIYGFLLSQRFLSSVHWCRYFQTVPYLLFQTQLPAFVSICIMMGLEVRTDAVYDKNKPVLNFVQI